MPVIADHDGRNHRAAPAHHPESTVAVGQFALDILDRIVPRARQPAFLPELCDRGRVGWLEVTEYKIGCCHLTSRPVVAAVIS